MDNNLKEIEIDDDFIAEVRARENEKHYQVFLPQEILDSHYCGKLYGYYVDATSTWNVLATESTWKYFNHLSCVGTIESTKEIFDYFNKYIDYFDPINDFLDYIDKEDIDLIIKKKNEYKDSIKDEAKANDKEICLKDVQPEYQIGIIEKIRSLKISEIGKIYASFHQKVENVLRINDERYKLTKLIEGDVLADVNGQCVLKSNIVSDLKSDVFIGILDNETNELSFSYLGKPIKIEVYSFVSEAFSRTKGILESDKMLQKKVVIVGCGSGGSFIALELAKSGVGHFLLSDNDVFGYHNISRHQCGVYDVGKRKVDAVKERILAINPYAEVVVYNEMIQKIYEGELDSFIDKNTVILSCGDNRASAHYCNILSEKYNVPFIAAGAGHRASTGEIFYYIPRTNMPCYSCVFGEDLSLDYSNEAQRVWYSTEEELEKQSFEPGLAADIDYISVIVCKLAIDLLNREEGNPKVLNFLPQYTGICNYLCSKDINPLMQIFQHPLQIKTKGLTTTKRDGCYLCAKIAELKQARSIKK